MRSEGQTALHIAMSEDERDAVNKAARAAGHRVTADYVRALIEKDTAARGQALTFEVKRGGAREGAGRKRADAGDPAQPAAARPARRRGAHHH